MIRRIKSLIDMVRGRGPVAVLNYIQYRYESSILRHDFMIKRIHGNKMYLDLRDRVVSLSLAIYGTREELETEVIKRELKEGMVVDIGANIGYYALIEASIVSDGGKVYAVEPYPPSYELLKKNVELNQYSDVIETEQIAISDKSGISKLYLGKTANVHSLIDYSNKWGKRGYIEVKTVAIDEFLKDKGKVDFIRMDIEGYERQVIGRLIDTLGNRKPPRILFETHPTGDVDPDPKFTSLVEKIIDFGYRPRTIISSSNEKSLKIFADLGYEPKKLVKAGKSNRGLFENIAAEDLIKVAFRRPKVTRAILLVHQSDL